METLTLTPQKIIAELSKQRIIIYDEKSVQKQIFDILAMNYYQFNHMSREFRLDSKNIIDILIEDIGVEIKIKGSPKSIYYQCERYCQFDQIKKLVLITNKVMRLPKEINGKPCYIYNLSKNWL
jgi:hypothetical protein